MTKEINRKNTISQAAAVLGRKGGKAKSEAKAKASRENGKLGGRPRMRDHVLSKSDLVEDKGYVLTYTAAGRLVSAEALKERVYSINGVDCIEMENTSTASGTVCKFFALEDIERNEQGWYIKPLRNARYILKTWYKSKPTFPKWGCSVSEDEKPYKYNNPAAWKQTGL